METPTSDISFNDIVSIGPHGEIIDYNELEVALFRASKELPGIEQDEEDTAGKHTDREQDEATTKDESASLPDLTDIKDDKSNTEPIYREKIEIDPRGDVVLQTSTKDLLVSSKVLSMASAVFDEMFNDDTRARPGYYCTEKRILTICLRHDDPEVLSLLCHLLHYRFGAVCMSAPDLDLLVKFAELSVKYQCLHAVQVQGSHWLRCATASVWGGKEDMRKALLAAYLLDDEGEFHTVSAKCAGMLSEEDLTDILINADLPAKVKVEIFSLRNKIFRNYLLAVECALFDLQEDKRSVEGYGKICTSCRTLKTKVRHHCKNPNFEPVLCTRDSRVSEFMDILRTCHLWPLTDKMDDVLFDLPTKFGDRLAHLGRRQQIHSCSQGTNCTMHTALSGLLSSLKAVEHDAQVPSWKLCPDRDIGCLALDACLKRGPYGCPSWT